MEARSVIRPDPPTRTVLVVDDGTPPEMSLADSLGALGYATWHADLAEAASPMLARPRADLIILELRRVDADGVLLGSDLREQTVLPVINACHASAQKRVAIDGLRHGADAFITWPIDLDELAARLEAVL